MMLLSIHLTKLNLMTRDPELELELEPGAGALRSHVFPGAGAGAGAVNFPMLQAPFVF